MTPSQYILLMLVSGIVSSLLILTGATVLVRATRAYRQAKTVVGAVITTYGQRLTRQEETCQGISKELIHLKVVCERLETSQSRSNESAKQTTIDPIDLIQALKETSGNIMFLNETLRTKEGGSWAASLLGRATVPLLHTNEDSLRMTPTEIQTLRILASEGGKTSTELHERVARSREHFGRLMKRLYERGYVDRDTSKTPFVYRINENMTRKISQGSPNGGIQSTQN